MTSNEIKNTNDSDSKKKNVSKTIQQENQAKVFLKSIRVSPIKLNLVVSPIRGEKVEKAINYLSFSNKRIAIQVKKALQSAIANAENNHQLDVDKLYISFSNLTIKLKEREKEIIKNNNKKNMIKKNTKEDLQKGELKNGTKS